MSINTIYIKNEYGLRARLRQHDTVVLPGEDQLIWAQTEALLALGEEMDSSRDLTADPCEDFLPVRVRRLGQQDRAR